MWNYEDQKMLPSSIPQSLLDQNSLYLGHLSNLPLKVVVYLVKTNNILFTEHLRCRWPMKHSVCRSHNPVIAYSFISCLWIYDQSNTMGTITRTGTNYPSRGHEFTSSFLWVRVAQSYIICVVFCEWLCVSIFPFDHCIACSFWFTVSDYPFCIFKILFFRVLYDFWQIYFSCIFKQLFLYCVLQ